MKDLIMNKMIDIEIFKKNMSTLKETSRDNHDGTDSFMNESLLNVVNFDGVKNDYVASLKDKIKESPKSSDALYIGNNELAFIEFKNGNIDKKKIYEVWHKIYDSLLLFMDITKETCSFTREHLRYILVYNEIKNQSIKDQETTVAEDAVQESPSRTMIEKYVAMRAKDNLIQFGLERFKKLYFKEVYTYNEKEFEDNFVQKVTLSPP